MQSVSAQQQELIALRRRVAELEQELRRAGACPEPEDQRGLSDITGDAFLAVDSQWRLTSVNTPAADLLGEAAGSCTGRLLWEIWPELSGGSAEQELRRTMDTRLPGASEACSPAAHGRLEGRYFPSPEGGLLAFFREAAEPHSALRLSEERLRLAQSAAAIGVWSLDLLDPSRNYWSPESYAHAGMDPHWQPSYSQWLELIHPEDRSRIAQTVQVALECADRYRIQYRLIRPDGVERWHESRGSVLRDLQGKPTGATGIMVDITERVAAERSLRENEERWRSLANAMPQFVWVANSFGHAEFINQYFFEYTGLPPGSMDLVDWTRVLHADDLPVMEAMWEASVRTGVEQRFEYRVRRASDGCWRWHLGFHKPQRDMDGRIVRWIGTGVEIHDQRETEQSLRDLEERQRLAVEAGNIGLWDWDIVNNRVTWSDRVYAFHGIPAGGFGGTVEEVTRLVHAQDRERVEAAIRAAVNQGSPYQLEFRTVRPNGEVHWLSTRACVMQDASGRSVRMLGAVTDVTDEVTARQELRSKTDQLSTLFEHASEAIFVTDGSGRFSDVNPAACRLLGYSAEELRKLTAADLVAPESRGRLAEVRQQLAAQQAHRGEWQMLHKDGSRVSVEISANRLPDGRSQAFVRDVREHRKLLEAATRLAAIVESSDDAIISTDLNNTILSWNAAAQRIFGYTAAEAVGRSVTMLATPGREDMQVILGRIRQGERVEHYETLRRTKSGRDLHISLSVSPIRDAAGTVVGSSKIARDISGRVRAEEELRRNQQQLQFVLDHAPAFIAYLDADFRYVRVNRAYEDWFGLPASEIVGKHMREALGADSFVPLEPHLLRVLQGESVSFDAVVKRPGSEDVHDFWVTYNPDRDAEGRVHGLIALLQDVTERNRHQRQIRERDEERQRLLAALPDVISRFGPDLRFTYASPAIERFTGKAPEHFVGRTHEEAGIPAFLAEDLRASLRRVFDSGEADRVEFDFPSPTLGARRMLGLAIPERDGDGRLSTVLTIVRDITEQRQAERDREELLEREREARETAELLNRVGPMLAAELDPEKLVQSVTDIATQLVGAEFGSLFHNVTNAAGESYLLYTLSGVPRDAFAAFPMPRNTDVFGPTFRGEGVVRSDDITKDPRYGKMSPHHGMPKGHLPVRSYLAAPVVSRSGEVLGGLFFGHSRPGQFTRRHEDILRGLAAQGAIAMDNARLFERSQNVQQELRRTNEDLRRAIRDLETFAYSASHDLQEPLRMMSINAQLLERRVGNLPADSREFLRNIQEGGVRMRALLADLLSYTRVTRQAEGPVSVVNAEHVLHRVVENLRSAIDESGAVVTHDALPPVRMLEIHLTQVLQNLVGNALKYRRAEAPRVHVSALGRDGVVTFAVADNGIGIDPQFREQVFGLFKRLHTREEYPGSGVGLAICQRVVEQYGGRIWVEGQASGPGSIFHFSVPGG